MDRALLLFEDKFPCWDEETFVLVGENVSSLSELSGNGLLVKDGGGYILTEEGDVYKRQDYKYAATLPNNDFARHGRQ